MTIILREMEDQLMDMFRAKNGISRLNEEIARINETVARLDRAVSHLKQRCGELENGQTARFYHYENIYSNACVPARHAIEEIAKHLGITFRTVAEVPEHHKLEVIGSANGVEKKK